MSDGNGKTWSITDELFRRTYECIEDSRWRRRGIVEARRSLPGETIETLEGNATAGKGYWVVQGESGEQ